MFLKKQHKCPGCKGKYGDLGFKIPTLGPRFVTVACDDCWSKSDKEMRHTFVDYIQKLWTKTNCFDKQARKYIAAMHKRVDEEFYNQESIELVPNGKELEAGEISFSLLETTGDDTLRPLEGFSVKAKLPEGTEAGKFIIRGDNIKEIKVESSWSNE